MENNEQTNKILSIIFIIFFYPFGIPFMWVTKSFSRKTRWIITLSFLFAIIFGLGALILWTSSPGYIH